LLIPCPPRSFATCPTQLLTNKKLQKSYTQGLSDCLSNPDVVVRDAASEALGILVKIFGESFLNKLLPGDIFVFFHEK